MQGSLKCTSSFVCSDRFFGQCELFQLSVLSYVPLNRKHAGFTVQLQNILHIVDDTLELTIMELMETGLESRSNARAL